ncbi:MAG: GTP 3',8-cyclase MoaA [Candidatus Bathyarchaeia archaeon]
MLGKADSGLVADRYGRPITNLRISITQKCDLECFYCHKEGQNSSSCEMAPTEIFRIAGIGVDFGVRRIKLTGGEPLLRRDLEEIVRLLSSLPNIMEISMVTNARRLTYERAKELREAGLSRINVNLPSVNGATYRRIVGRDIGDVLRGVESAVKAELLPIKINMVLLKGLNSEEVESMMRFAKERGATLQLIELEPLKGGSLFYQQYHCSLEGIERNISSRASQVKVRYSMQMRRVYTVDGIDVEVVRPVGNPEFCKYCTKMRLTSDGKLKPCLMTQNNLLDILSPMRRGEDDEVLRKIFMDAVNLRRPYYCGDLNQSF